MSPEYSIQQTPRGWRVHQPGWSSTPLPTQSAAGGLVALLRDLGPSPLGRTLRHVFSPSIHQKLRS